MKRSIALILTFTLIISIFNVCTLTVQSADSVLTQCYGWYETIHMKWSNDTAPSKAKVEYRKSGTQTYTPIDSQLIRSSDDGCVADIVGISQGIYDIRITASSGQVIEKSNIPVARHDRSGYGHFGTDSGVGGYNNDGTPKSNAQIVYVTNETKNTVKLGSYTGLCNIVKKASGSGPLIVRIIGKIDTQTRDSDGTKKTDINNGVVALNGLTDKVLDKDSYFNMLDVDSVSNITIEGIGTDAVIEKWGFTFKKCSSIEVRNLTFTKYPEDACSFEGSTSSPLGYKNFWVHNNYFKIGENKYDITTEQDKHEGDGSTDFKGCSNITFSYNVYERCHKTALHGGGDGNKQYNSTWHHNYLNNVSSRMPLTRQVNLHSYNNYFLNGGKCIDARASAWVLSEANNFENSLRFLTTANSTYGDPIIKSYRDVYDTDKKSDEAGTIVITNDRTLQIPVNKGKNTNKNPYPNFDTNTSWFYYDSVNGKSDVEYLTDGDKAKSDVLQSAGIMKEGAVLPIYLPSGNIEESTETTTYKTETTTKTTETTETTTEVTTYVSHVGESMGGGNGEVYKLVPSDFTSGSKSSYQTKGVFTITAESGRAVSVNANYIDLGGSGKAGPDSYRAIAVNTTGRASINVKFFNNGSNDRTLAVKTSADVTLAEKAAPMGGSKTNLQTLTVNVDSEGVYYILSLGSGIKITEVTLTYPSGENMLIGDTDGSKKIETADAVKLLKHIAGLEKITDTERLDAADGNRDGKQTMLDVIAIMEYLKK